MPLETPKFHNKEVNEEKVIEADEIEEFDDEEEKKEPSKKKTLAHKRSKSTNQQIEEHLLPTEVSQLVGSPSQLNKRVKEL
jgi:hypothetical protein